MAESVLHNRGAVAFLPSPGRRRLLQWIGCGVAGTMPATTLAQADLAPAGALLVAAPAIDAGMFARSVVLVAPIFGGETVGVVLDRLQDVALPAEFTLAADRAVFQGVFRGGPLATPGYFALAESPASPGALAVAVNLHFAAGIAASRALLRVAAGRVRLFHGYAGWGPGQLASEIAGGYWRVRAVDADEVFDADPGTQWERLSTRQRAV